MVDGTCFNGVPGVHHYFMCVCVCVCVVMDKLLQVRQRLRRTTTI